MAESKKKKEDIFKSTREYIKKANINSKIATILRNRLAQIGKKAKSYQSVPPAPKVEYLTYDKIMKELNKEGAFTKYDVIDMEGRLVLAPAGYQFSPQEIELMIQLVKSAPRALYIRIADSVIKDKIEYDSKEKFPSE